LVFDAEGNAYGTTINGGTSNFGTVFELTPHSNGYWTETVLHDFNCKGNEGCMPTAGLAIDAAGDLYGTAKTTTFELSPGSGGWNLTVLQNEGGPFNLILDQAGNLYGPLGLGQYGQGAISELVKDDAWTEKWLYSFCSKNSRKHDCLDGSYPYAGVTWGPDGNLYGTTVQYGVHGYGVVFRLAPQQDGTWEETVLHSFPAFEGDGQKPYEGVVLDKAGNVYGATYQGGSSTSCGVIFKLAPQADGQWKESILYDFPKLSQGCIANTMAFDAHGNLWGTAQSGGASDNGVVFELTPQPSGKWKYQVMHQFNGKELPAWLRGHFGQARQPVRDHNPGRRLRWRRGLPTHAVALCAFAPTIVTDSRGMSRLIAGEKSRLHALRVLSAIAVYIRWPAWRRSGV
jgi:uncharacterized repeat protein (TIGR03803 family)